MKRFSKLMSLLLFAAVTQYSCINDADVVIAVPNRPALPPKVLKKNMR